MDRCDVAIVGAGPYGLSAAAHLRQINGLDIRLFGEPMSFWERHMPERMLLRSPWAASSIADPHQRFCLDAYRTHRSSEGAGPLAEPVPVADFIRYGRWVLEQMAVRAEGKVMRVDPISGGYQLTLQGGDRLMARRVVVVLVLVAVLVGAGLVVTYVQKARLAANLVASQNNLRELALFAAHHANPDPKKEAGRLLNHVPAATVVLAGVPPEDRLSWVVPVLPGLDQRRQDIPSLLTQIDDTRPWAEERNQRAARTRLAVLTCPGNPPQVPPDAPAVTCYVAVAGLGPDAATLPLPAAGPVSPRAGAWRYDTPTPFDKIADGLSQTLLLGETADAPGPWLRGGPSTTRGLDDAPGAKPLIGSGGQFGGFFPGGANFALCDGSVRVFTPRTTPGVLLRMATIAGGGNEPLPGD